MMTDDRRAAIMAELRASLGHSPLEPDEFTSMMYAKEHGLTRDAAYKELQRAVEKGLVERRRIVDGRRVNAYRMRPE